MQSESSQTESSSPKLSTERSAVLISTAISRAPSASERGADDAQTSSPEYGKNEKTGGSGSFETIAARLPQRFASE